MKLLNLEIKKQFIIVFGIVVIIALFFIIKLFDIRLGPNSDGDIVNQGHKLSIKSNYSSFDLNVNYVKRNVTINGLNYTKINVTAKNTSKSTIEFNLMNSFFLLDSDDKVLSTCKTKKWVNNNDDALADEIEGYTTESGFIYCQTDSSNGIKLKVPIISNFGYNRASGYSTDISLENYYIKLK